MTHLITSNESKIHNPSACVTDRDRDHQPKPWQVSSAMEFHYFRVHLLLSPPASEPGTFVFWDEDKRLLSPGDL